MAKHAHGDAVTQLDRIDASYAYSDGKIVLIVPKGQRVVEQVLADFLATIAEEITYDDGDGAPTLAFRIDGIAHDGTALPALTVPAKDYPDMRWVSQWGTKAIVSAGRGIHDHLRAAILTLSQSVRRRTVYAHTGWRDLDGQLVYLSSTGALGAGAGVEVDLGDLAQLYAIPPIAEDPAEAWRASLALWDLGADGVTIPLWCAIFAAPLNRWVQSDYTVWLAGPTGSLKTTLACLLTSHYGTHRPETVTPWSATANALERRAFVVKDAVLVIDDYAPPADAARVWETTAERVIRAQGNRAGRVRLASDLSERKTYAPRGLIVSTGETYPRMASVLARMLVLPVATDTLDRERVHTAQSQVDRLRHAMADYLHAIRSVSMEWVAGTYEEIRRGMQGRHLRTASIVAHLWCAARAALAAAQGCGALTNQDREAREMQAWEALVRAAEAHEALMVEENPGQAALKVLSELIASGKVVIMDRDLGAASGGSGEMIGWEDREYYYLLPAMTYRAISKTCREAGLPLMVTQRQLAALWAESGVLHGQRETHTALVRIAGLRRRVWRIPTEVLVTTTDSDQDDDA
jgi:hypothetical protein